jgi:hypothetical protein
MSAATVIYSAVAVLAVGGLIWMLRTVQRTGWTPWHDDEA